VFCIKAKYNNEKDFQARYLHFSALYRWLSCLLFSFPRNYDVPQLQERKSTQYWTLSDESKIGYTLIPAKGEKKPYPIIYLHGGSRRIYF
jgi:hypothetical protein